MTSPSKSPKSPQKTSPARNAKRSPSPVKVSSPKKQKTHRISLENIQAVVCDIEGTTTPISFVHDVLFPLVLEQLVDFLNTHWDEKDLQKMIEDLYQQSVKDKADKRDGLVEIKKSKKQEYIASIVANVKWQMSIDRKAGPLKALQGYMWKSAYEANKIKGIVYQDVLDQFKNWKSKEIKIYIYSSGSIKAQKLLFKYSDKGDLLEYFSGHFDTGIGGKLESKSYEKITKEIGLLPKEILFLSDNIKENEAAKEAGLYTLNVKRAGNAEIKDFKGIEQIESFLELDL